MVTQAEVTTYLVNVRTAQSIFMDKLLLKEKLGRAEIVYWKVLAALLNCYVTIIVDYFSQATYPGGYFDTDYNFFDETEAKEIIFRINKVCDIDLHLDL